MSVSATATTSIGLTAVFACTDGASSFLSVAAVLLLSADFGGPSGNAVVAGPVICAAITSFLPLGLKPASRAAGSGVWNLSAGISIESVDVVINGVNAVLAPANGSRMPGVATLIRDKSAVIGLS
jgi:hypothetical protein